jgi:hypothetical protein
MISWRGEVRKIWVTAISSWKPKDHSTWDQNGTRRDAYSRTRREVRCDLERIVLGLVINSGGWKGLGEIDLENWSSTCLQYFDWFTECSMIFTQLPWEARSHVTCRQGMNLIEAHIVTQVLNSGLKYRRIPWA